MLKKNVAGQKWIVFAYQDEGGSNPGEPVTGDAANITANLRIDGAAANAVDDTNPTELEDGFYVFDLTQTETNGDLIVICPASATANVNVVGAPAAAWTMDLAFNGIIATGTLQSATTTTAVLAAATNFVNDLIIGAVLHIYDGTGAGQTRSLTDWAQSTDTATVDTWTTTPDNTSKYILFAAPPAPSTPPDVNVAQINGATVTGDGNATPWDGA